MDSSADFSEIDAYSRIMIETRLVYAEYDALTTLGLRPGATHRQQLSADVMPLLFPRPGFVALARSELTREQIMSLINRYSPLRREDLAAALESIIDSAGSSTDL